MEIDKILALNCLDHLEEPIFVISRANNSLCLANRPFLHLIGKNELYSILGQNIHSFWPNYEEISAKEVTTALIRNDENNNPEKIFVKMNKKNFGDFYTIYKVIAAQLATAQKELFQAQRLETLGMLAGAVSHDFNNILTGILGHTTYLKSILPSAGPHIESLHAIDEGVSKGAILTQQVLNFSKLDSVIEPVEINLKDSINKTLLLLRKAIPHRIKLITKFDCPDPYILGIEGQLTQAIVNLVMNAKDAITEEGSIELSLRLESNPDYLAKVFNNADLSSRNFVVITVKDDGVGIPKENLDKVFQKFFSTKQDKGTGLGLSTVVDIVQNLGGTVTLSSQVGAGTNIGIYLPIHRLESNSTDTVKTLSIRKGSERILIVDDEAPVRNILAVSLQHLGYTVSMADSAFSAIDTIKNSTKKFDLIISDMLMPMMSGDQFFFYLKEYFGEDNFNFLIISGFSDSVTVNKMLSAGAKGFLAKPFSVEDLCSKLGQILDS